MKRLVSSYLLMVGIPLGVILLVLHAGSDAVAPPSIEGDWVMQAAPEATAKCADPLAGLSRGPLVVSQSGRYLTAHWGQDRTSEMIGALDGGQFILCSSASAAESCAVDPHRLNGRIHEENGSRRLELRLSASAGGDCRDLSLISSWRRIDLAARTPEGI